jgi:hypothetical protein
MKNKGLIGIVLWLVLVLPAHAFSTVDEQIDYYLVWLADGSFDEQVQVLQRLQWSGLTDPRLFDEIEQQLLAGYLNTDLDKYGYTLLSHRIRALGFSGETKYHDTLTLVSKEAANKKNRKFAQKALKELPQFNHWNKLIAETDISVEGKSVEVTNYIKMLHVDDFNVRRRAARAVYDERRQDPELLALIASNLEGLYLQDGLGKQYQDTAAWYCKALGRNAGAEYKELLSKVATTTPYKKIKKYAAKYAQ